MPQAREADRLELALSRCAEPTIGRQQWGAYFVCGLFGYLAGVALVAALADRAGLDPAVRLALVLVPPTALLWTIKLSQFLYQRERIVYYQQALAAVGTTAIAVAIMGGPVARAIDLATLGMGIGLAFGRVGCFRVACCHGRVTRRGVRYREVHAAAGFPARWVGVPLVPLQLLDGAASALTTAAATFVLVRGAAPGVAACVYALGYGVVRCGLELGRGDPIRPRAYGVSEAQWTACATTLAAAMWRTSWWTIGGAAIVAVAIAALVIARRRDLASTLWLAGAHHVHEVAVAIERGVATTTSEGVALSSQRLADGRLDVVLSRPGRGLDERALAHLAAQLGRPWRSFELRAGRTPGLVHLLLTQEDQNWK